MLLRPGDPGRRPPVLRALRPVGARARAVSAARRPRAVIVTNPPDLRPSRRLLPAPGLTGAMLILDSHPGGFGVQGDRVAAPAAADPPVAVPRAEPRARHRGGLGRDRRGAGGPGRDRPRGPRRMGAARRRRATSAPCARDRPLRAATSRWHRCWRPPARSRTATSRSPGTRRSCPRRAPRRPAGQRRVRRVPGTRRLPGGRRRRPMPCSPSPPSPARSCGPPTRRSMPVAQWWSATGRPAASCSPSGSTRPTRGRRSPGRSPPSTPTTRHLSPPGSPSARRLQQERWDAQLAVLVTAVGG